MIALESMTSEDRSYWKSLSLQIKANYIDNDFKKEKKKQNRRELSNLFYCIYYIINIIITLWFIFI